MISKQQYIESILTEIAIIRHLGTKVTADMLAYRPHEKQRTMLELMHYMGHAFETGVLANIAGDSAVFIERAKNAPHITLETFDAAMERQTESIRTHVEALTEEDFKREANVFGRTATLAMHLLSVMKWATAYKMQFFLYLKACGNHDINTSNLWRGTDPAPKI